MVQRKRRGGKASSKKEKCKSHLRSLPKKSYKEDKDTQSENSEDDDYDDDDDFEPLKKYAMKSQKKKQLSKENVDSKVIKITPGKIVD